jgi:hypothetical protein
VERKLLTQKWIIGCQFRDTDVKEVVNFHGPWELQVKGIPSKKDNNWKRAKVFVV